MFNLRDVGGYPTADGGAVRWGRLLRGDAPHRLTDRCRRTFAALGLRTALDLRTAAERRRAEAAWGDLPVAVEHLPVLETVETDSLESLYRRMTDVGAARLAGAVVAVSRAVDGSVLVHCSAGKDRTGLVVALILSAIGVEDRYVLEDYVLTSRYLNPGTTEALRQLRGEEQDSPPKAPELLACPPQLLADSLARLRSRYDGIHGFLRHHGASFADLARLRAQLVTTAS